MSYSNKQRRGRYATNACTNCRKKHIKCSEEATCTHCALQNLKCTYSKPVKKRGPKVSANVFESNSDKASNIEHKNTLIQFSEPIPFCLDYNYNEEYQAIQNYLFSHINTNNILLNNNAPVNFFGNTFSLPKNLSPDSSSIASNLDYLF
ncbi:4188_t:CDS:1 [Racocetra persica]|uniref:4188_t:CDS:1 n=1 Tax=Racocetra persica TaxID=160502 RepID=A0ACA9R7H1_9GLOM|nr:4188_t:CDS:1 [Racocetra persica]